MAVTSDCSEIFNNLSSKIGNLLFGRTEVNRNILSKTLDDLNSINYRYTIVTNHTKAVLLVNQCCSFIPTDDKILVQKCCQLLWSLINRQNVSVEGRTLTISVQWCLSSLRIKDTNVTIDILQALDALLRSNVNNIPSLINNVTKEVSSFLNSKNEGYSPEIIVLSLQCMEACTAVPDNYKSENRRDLLIPFEACAEIFVRYLTTGIKNVDDDLMYCKVLKICLNGVQNIIIQHPDYLKQELGVILGIIKTFMVYGIKGIDYIVPQKLLPATLSVPEVSNNFVREKKGGKLTKQRKHRSAGINKDSNRSTDEFLYENKNTDYTPATTTLDCSSDSGVNGGSGSRIKTSDSDFSDSEAGKTAKLGQIQGRIRQAALNLFYNVVKLIDKSTVFSYWTSFIPEGATSGPHNLLTCVLKDPSAKSRMAALNIILLLLTSSKLYLLQAESSEKSTSFTPFSVVMGLMIIELHKGLSLALNEMSVPVLIQVLKCFAALVQATPYHKMPQCLIAKVIRNVKKFIYYKDASIQVTALIVLGCVLASEPVMPETKESMLNLCHLDEKSLQIEEPEEDAGDLNESFDFAEFSESEDEVDIENTTVPWLLKKCLNNLGVKQLEESAKTPERNDQNLTVPAPVKLESLQVLSAMSRNYFDSLMVPHLGHITKALDISLSDKYSDLRLHAGRAVDFIGQALSRYISSEDTRNSISMDQCLLFWQVLLNGSLLEILQCDQYPILRAVGCDCLGSIGQYIFEQLPRDKQILCITLLFSCTQDEENSVKGAAVRALAICVLYPSLRQDSGFVIDTAESIYRTLQDKNLMVRVKASWSLGNLSDALVLNRKSCDMEEIPENLIQKLLQASIGGASDNDKVKMNAVRAIGNLLQLITDELIQKPIFTEFTEKAFSVLVKNCTTGSNMKVRWNACYALGNAMKNSSLYTNNSWQLAAFNALTELVVNFRNFKVRINAAVALSSPSLREHYGSYFHLTWIAFLKSLENSQNMEDFSEYKHRDHLVEQVCLALGHLTTLLQRDDLIQLGDTVYLYLDTLISHVHRVLERLIPEKSTTLFSASYALSTLDKQNDLNKEQKNFLKCLTDVFVPKL